MPKNQPRQGRPYDGRPKGHARSGRRAGTGPGPGYRPSSSGGGTKHGSSTGTRAMVWIAAGIFSIPVTGMLAAAWYVIRGHLS